MNFGNFWPSFRFVRSAAVGVRQPCRWPQGNTVAHVITVMSCVMLPSMAWAWTLVGHGQSHYAMLCYAMAMQSISSETFLY